MTQLLEHTTGDEEDEESEDRTSNLVDTLFVSKDPFFLHILEPIRVFSEVEAL